MNTFSTKSQEDECLHVIHQCKDTLHASDMTLAAHTQIKITKKIKQEVNVRRESRFYSMIPPFNRNNFLHVKFLRYFCIQNAATDRPTKD